MGLTTEREALYKKIDERVDLMFNSGLIDEVRGLLKMRLSRTAKAAIGIAELREYFKGRLSLKDTIELIKRNTRRYAKRQLTYFRKDKRINWIKILPGDSDRRILARIIGKIR